MEIAHHIKQGMVGYLTKAQTLFLELFVPNKNNAFRPRALKSNYLFWYASGLLTVKIALITLALLLPATNFFSSIAIDQLAVLINQERQAKNLPALALNTSLNSVANLKVNDMLAQNYFEHTSPSGITPWYWFKQIGYNFAYAGENLAMGFIETDTVFTAWMNSPTHRDNILNPNFREMGLAVKSGSIQNHADTLAVLVFGRPAAEIVRSSGKQGTKSQGNATSAGTISKEKTISALERPTPFASSKIKTSVAPSLIASPATTPSAAPRGDSPVGEKLYAEQITLKTAAETKPAHPSNIVISDTTNIKWAFAPRVLGAFVSKSDEIFKSLYLYFTLFMAIALAVNIFVKIEIQYWPTIFATTLVILLSVILIFI